MTVTELTQEDFVKKVYDFETNPNAWKFEGDKPAVIDFYATWCGPCKMMSPILDEISKEYEGKINVYKVNVDKEADLASVFGIRSIPSLLFVPMKKEPSMVQGAMPRNELKKLVDDILFSVLLLLFLFPLLAFAIPTKRLANNTTPTLIKSGRNLWNIFLILA